MLLWVSFICTEFTIGINEKLFSLCWRAALRLLLDESIKVSIPWHYTLSPLIWSIQQYCCNKPMITYPATWKTVLILSYDLDTSRTLCLVPTDVSLWDVNPAAERTLLKGSGLVSGRWVLLVSRVLADRPLLTCMSHPQLQQSCHYVQNQSCIPCYHLVQEQEKRDYGRRNIEIFDMVLVLAIYSF